MPTPLPQNSTPPVIPSSLAHHSITPAAWFSAHPRLAQLCVGGLIFRLSPITQTPEILLIKRASSDFFPNLWEIPGGSVEASDATILDAVVREVWEETGLLVKEFKRQVWDDRVGLKVMGSEGKEVIVGENPGEGEVEFLGGGGEVWCKLNFLVDVGEVLEGQVKLDVEEHQDCKWATKADIVGLHRKEFDFISEQAVKIVERGFEEFEARK